MVTPVNIAPGIGKPVEPQAFYVQTYVPNTALVDWMPGPADYPWTPPPPPIQQSITWSQVQMIGRDVLPTGQQLFDRPPFGPPRPEQTWYYNLLENTLSVGGPLGFIANQYDWPLPRAPYRIEQTWTWNQVLMIGQDAMVVGQQVTDLPIKLAPKPIDQTWTWNQIPMIGRDRLPTGQQRYDLTVPAPYRIDQTWVWSQVRMIGQDQLPVGARSYESPIPPPKPIQETWVWNQVPMIGRDQRLAGKQVYELATLEITPKPIDQTWTWRQVGMIGQDRMLVGQQVYDLAYQTRAPRLDETWVWNQIPMLGMDRLPVGQQSYDLTPKSPPRLEQTWYYNLLENTLSVLGPLGVVANQYDWPLARAPQQPALSWSWSQVEMIGQDKMVVGQQVTDLPPRDFQRLFQTWINAVNVALVTTPESLEATIHRIENVLPQQPFRPEQTWIWRQVDKIGQDAMLIGQQIYDRPQQPTVLLQTWAQGLNLNLIIQVVPFASVTELPRQPSRIDQTTTWNQTPMLGQDRMLVGKQLFDLPVRRPAPIEQTTAWRQVGMIGQDRLPVGQAQFDLPRQPVRLEQPWSQGFNLALFSPLFDLTKVVRQQDWPIPRGYPPLIPDAGANFTIHIPFVPPPSVIPLRTLMGTGV